eukprot:6214331-Pleurochrysis_carterae.AAC.2
MKTLKASARKRRRTFKGQTQIEKRWEEAQRKSQVGAEGEQTARTQADVNFRRAAAMTAP